MSHIPSLLTCQDPHACTRIILHLHCNDVWATAHDCITLQLTLMTCRAPNKTPDSIPRRLAIPDTFDGSPNYTVLSRLGELEGWHIAAALLPAGIIAVLFFFDHNVSSQLAQEGLHLTKPTAYHWDLMVLALMTLACGLLGLPPVNGVIPQAPMHSRANTVWLKDKAKKREDEDGTDAAAFNVKDEAHGGRDFYIRENRVSNLVQSVLCGVCLLITPILQQIPRSVLWGFFAFMAIEGLPGTAPPPFSLGLSLLLRPFVSPPSMSLSHTRCARACTRTGMHTRAR